MNKQIINEVTFTEYEGWIRVTYKEGSSASEVATFLRAMPGVTKVTSLGSNTKANSVILDVKVLTARTGAEAFMKVRREAVRMIPSIAKVEISTKSIKKIED